jgi:hypothetical protein
LPALYAILSSPKLFKLLLFLYPQETEAVFIHIQLSFQEAYFYALLQQLIVYFEGDEQGSLCRHCNGIAGGVGI